MAASAALRAYARSLQFVENAERSERASRWRSLRELVCDAAGSLDAGNHDGARELLTRACDRHHELLGDCDGLSEVLDRYAELREVE